MKYTYKSGRFLFSLGFRNKFKSLINRMVYI